MSRLARQYALVLRLLAVPMLVLLMLLSGCRAGAARAAQLPQPTSLAQWVAIVVFVLGLWWVAMKILRG